MANENCIICDRAFATNAKGGFVGRRVIRTWDAPVQSDCVRGNRDGVVPNDALLERLARRGIEPVLNESGWVTLPAVS